MAKSNVKKSDIVTKSAEGIVEKIVENSTQEKEEKTVKKRNGWDVFIQAFQSSSSRKEVAQKLGVTIACVYSREKNYRKAGVNLKEMKRTGRNKLDVNAANDLIASMEN